MPVKGRGAMREYWVMMREKADIDIELVRDGFSWGACLIPLFWALYRRLWRVFFILLAVVIGLSILWGSLGLGETGVMIANVAQAVVLGFLGNELRRWELGQKGFKTVDIVAARRFDDAEEKAVIRLAEHEAEQQETRLAENSFPQGLHPPSEQSI